VFNAFTHITAAIIAYPEFAMDRQISADRREASD
jgi:hypothetical protein